MIKKKAQPTFEDTVHNNKLVMLTHHGFGRGFGHTTAMLEGAKHNPKTVVIAADARHASELARQGVRAVPSSRIEEELRSTRGPVLVDHFALQLMVVDLIRELTAAHQASVQAAVRAALETVREQILHENFNPDHINIALNHIDDELSALDQTTEGTEA